MSKKLAIRGHSARGKEVIELLTMMGGRDVGVLKGNHDYYVIDECENNLIKFYGHNYIRCHEFVVFTLEEFLEKYPFKVGDKVVYTKFGNNCDDYPVTIEYMKWTGTTIEYTFNDCVTCLAKDLKMWNGEPDAVISGIYLNSCDYADEVELNLGDYEIEVRDGKTYAVKKKPKYPKTYVECCKVLGISYRAQLSYTNPEVECSNIYLTKEKHLLDTFMKLRICRNAYWKIAGEQMGLDKPWEPKFGKTILFDITFYFYQDNFVIHKGEYDSSDNCILVFPTAEMRDAFFEDFKDLIEQCKELL